MKVMTCRQLGGACDEQFRATTFDEISKLSKEHGMQMFQKKDKAHLEAMQKMREQMVSNDSQQMKDWLKTKKAEFDALPEL